ncbi:neuron navigator 2-like isoform X3 [Haliotis rufescens]|uniref:neuron navigator 2-like isoform X3 n=1 Tax=Haliotis rufescens TaxID=6454 RepID=UPI00201EEF0A|nr:neuron navigator 2-like isoform X3 [Haliotis rufescens]
MATGTVAPPRMTRIPVPASKQGHGSSSSFIQSKNRLMIYTDWANHYLEKARNKRFIADLQQDITDGVLLADVIEAVTNEKIKDIKTKPKNSAQMVENINTCLTFLASLGVSVDGLSAKDIKDGNLKAILGLFFSLSRFKQQQKTQQQTTKPPEQAKDPPSTPQLSHPGIAVVDGAPNSGGRTTPQVNGGEMLSRLPSPFKHSNKNPASISNLSTSKDSSNSNSNLNQSRGKPTLHGANSTSNDKVRSHLNQQNNNNNLQGSNLVSPKNNNNNSVSHRATSPSSASQSGIPTPGGRSLGRPTPTAEKQSNRTSASSTSSTSSTKSNPSKPSGNNKNSMLDKFKFFNSKEKEKGKSGVVKSASKTSNTSTTSTSSRSDTDSKTSSYSARSSSSTDAGASSSTTNGSSSPKLPAKTGKKSLARAFSTKRDNANTLAPDSNINVGKRNTPSPSSQNRTPSPNPSARNSPVPVRKTEGKGVKSEKGPPKECQPSPPTSKKGTKIGSLIPKSSSSQSGKSSKSSGSSQIPAPSSGIPKSASGKSSKSSKEDRKNGSSSSSQHSKSLYASLPGMNAHKTLSSGSPKVQSPASTPEGCYPSLSSIPISQMSLSQMQQRQQQMENLDQQQLQQQQILMQREHHPRVNLQEQQIRQEQIRQEQIRQEHIRQENERYDLMRQEQIRKNEQSRTTEHSSPCITVPRATAHVMAEITIPPKSSHGSQMGHLSTFKGGDRSPRSQMVSPSPSGSVTLTQTVNVVKPTCAMAPTTRSVTKADGNTQTNLSVLQRTITPTKYLTEAMKENSSNSIHSSTSSQVGTPEQVSSDSTPSSQSGHSSCDSIVMKSPASELLAAHDRATTNSPKLGVKMLNSHLGKPANNIAVVQPRHGEKVETTFDTEVRTETINKNSLGKETTFSEKETTFVDDAGETMDIKPMPPIMRALPYGYFRGYSGYSGLSSSRNFHIPGISVPQTTMYAASTPSRLGVNRPLFDHGKYYSGQIKRTNSNCPSVSDTDYGSDIDTYDYVSGYMSDGDILKSNRGEEWASGYLSEGGASLYARRLQQRFREGMQAVRECMQKSSGLVDDDSFDDSSSISSGDISDTIAEISTDENLTGSSQGALSDTNPYSSLKRTPKDLTRGFSNGGGTSQVQGKRVPNLGTSAFMGSDYNSDSGHIGWRKYSLPQNSKLLSSDPSDYAYPYSNGYDHSQWRRTDSSSGYGSLRKLSNASQPEFGYRGEHVSYAESEKGTCSTSPSTKRDCETNTDNSHLLETSMKRMQNARGANCGSGGSSSSFGYRRPLSNASNSSIGSNKSSSSKGSATVGSRLAKHGVDANPMSKSANEMPASNIPRPGSASARTNMKDSDLGPEGYCSNTLERERKKKNGISASKSTSSAQTERDFQSNTLGRRRLFGSKNSLSKTPQGENGSLCNSTIISNPHATYSSKSESSSPSHGGKNTSHYVNLQQLQAAAAQQNALQANPNYIALEYSSPRNSGSNGTWLKSANGHLMHVSDTEESLSSAASSIQAQIQQARALSGASARILAHQRDSVHGGGVGGGGGGGGGLRRSNSIKSTQSDCVYSSSTKHSACDDLPRTNSFSQLPSPSSQQPSSPTPSSASQSSRFTYPMMYSPNMLSSNNAQHNMVRSSTQSSLPYSGLALSKLSKQDEEGSRLSKSSTLDYAYLSDYAYSSVHGSNLSLVSTSSSVYSSAEEKQQAEVRKLQRELVSAQDKVLTLQTQLNTNRADTIFYKNQAHVVAAFEQSLSNMTSRLQMLTSTAEQKVVRPSQENIQDSELNELRQTIEALKRQSGLSIQESLVSPNVGRRHTSPGEGGRIVRQMSSDSMSSINSLSSACSVASQQSAATDGDIGKNSKKNKKKGWLRSSFSKAFSRKKNKHGSISDVEPDTASLRSNASAPNSPLLQMTHVPNGSGVMKGSHSSGALCETEDHASVNELKNLLREKDMKLTDIRLEALSSAHQLEQLRETMNKMKSEMGHLKADNDRLQRLATSSRTLNISQSSLAHTRASNDSLDRSLSLTDQSSLDMLLAETAANDREGKRVTITVYLGSNPDPTRMGIERPAEVLIGSLSVSGKTKWDILDNIVRKIFKEYVLRVDPVTNLGLSAESVFSYHIGDITRTKDADLPELLPVGYLVGETMQISICLKGTKQISVDSLAFESMIPKTIIQRYVSLLIEHRRIILCGPSGTGKTYLAQKLAEHLVLRSGRELTAGSVATFNVDHKSSKDLRQYLSNIAEQCENTNVNELPTVIILDNLHHVGSLGEVFNGFLSVKYQKCPYIIGTMNQATNAATNLQLHHNFRWVLCANHMEPVKGFLGRYLRRKLVEAEVRTGMRNNDLNKIIDWVPKVWAHINKFLETHSSSDVTIGPRLFLSCPMDISGSQVWFTDLWNYSLVPYMLEAVREGLQVYGKRAPWEDPTDWVIESYPWSGGSNNDKDKSLLRIRPEDVGYDSQTAQVSVSGNKSKTKTAGNTSEGDPGDPLVNMLMRLQEAASYSSPQSNDSDSTSLDSHSSIQEFSSSSVESTL